MALVTAGGLAGKVVLLEHELAHAGNRNRAVSCHDASYNRNEGYPHAALAAVLRHNRLMGHELRTRRCQEMGTALK
jgi:hypothetical protein